jgi:hypothetical protein
LHASQRVSLASTFWIRWQAMVAGKIRKAAIKRADFHPNKAVERKRQRGHFKKVKRRT